MNAFYQHMVQDMIDEAEDGVYDLDGLDNIVGYLMDDDVERSIIHGSTEEEEEENDDED